MELNPSLPNRSRNFRKILSLLISINWWVNQLWFKRYIQKYTVSCTNTHHYVTDLVNHGMVKNTKAWISWERNITFLWNKKILNLCLRWHILRSYCFVVKVPLMSLFVVDNLWLLTFQFFYPYNCFYIRKRQPWCQPIFNQEVQKSNVTIL